MTNNSLLSTATAIVAFLLASCRPTTPEAVSASELADAAHTTHEQPDVSGGVLAGAGPWIATARGGAHVTVSSPGAPFLPGPVELAISVHVPDGHQAAHSVDLVSPTMPVHGIVRYGVTDGTAKIDIPMEGRWAIYVNLDESGSDSAEFLFDVAPMEGGGHAHHGGTSP